MSERFKITLPNGEEAVTPVPKIAAVHPFGSKILVEVLRNQEILNTKFHVSDKAEVEGAPQGIIVEIGPTVDTQAGLKVGQRVYWTGKGTAVNDPRAQRGRQRAMLELSNILGIIEEEEATES